jgi:hypothetical protein
MNSCEQQAIDWMLWAGRSLSHGSRNNQYLDLRHYDLRL